MTPRHRIYTVLAGLHLLLAACGAAQWNPLPPRSDAAHALQVIRSYTGSEASFGFFAPGVSLTVRPTFTLTDANGKKWTDTLDANMAREAQLRVGSGVGLAGSEPDLILDFAKSWAATMLGRHPTAKTVTVGLEVYDVPTMEAYRAGERAQCVQVFPPPEEPELGVFHRK